MTHVCWYCMYCGASFKSLVELQAHENSCSQRTR